MHKRAACFLLLAVPTALCFIETAGKETVMVTPSERKITTISVRQGTDKKFLDQVALVAAEDPNDMRLVSRHLLEGFSFSLKYTKMWRMHAETPDTYPRERPAAGNMYLVENTSSWKGAKSMGLKNLDDFARIVKSWKEDRAATYKLLLPKRAMGYALLVLNMASIPGYVARHISVTTLEEVAEVLWTFSLLNLDEWAGVHPAYSTGPVKPTKTKWECFKENLKDLILTSESTAVEVGRVLRETDQLGVLQAREGFMPLHIIPRDKIEWFFLTKAYSSIQWYLYTVLSAKVSNCAIYARFVEDTEDRHAVSVLFKHQVLESSKHTPLPVFLREHSTRRVRTLSIAIDTDMDLSEKILLAVLDIFPRYKTVVFTSLGNENDVRKNTSLVERVLEKEAARLAHGYAPSLHGLVLNYIFSLTGKALTYIEGMSLKKFGFYRYYPRSYIVRLLSAKKKDTISLFLDRLLTGESPFSKTLKHLVAPDTLFFTNLSVPGALPALQAIEVHVQVENWNRPYTNLSPSEFIMGNANITTLVLVESFPYTEGHTVFVFEKLAALPNIKFLDLSKTSLSLGFFKNRFSTEFAANYKNTLQKLYIPYTDSLSRLPEDTNAILLITQHLPYLKSFRLFFSTESHLSESLPLLLRDINAILTSTPLSSMALSSMLSFRFIKRLHHPGSVECITSRFDMEKIHPSSAYAAAFSRSSSKRLSLPELSRVLSLSSQVHLSE
ncbi:hypothetical protein NECID01_0513 [Nematocida sp. AWRm77]|nr:hypothetical protein NECID01_0513 [Nematocida sp. AWRm77]